MDVSKFKVPGHWPADAQEFDREAIAEIQELKTAMKTALADIVEMRVLLGKAQVEIRSLKEKLR